MTELITNASGIITSYRRGQHRMWPSQILCKFDGFDTKEAAAKLIGHVMEWVSDSGTSIKGKITRTHGGHGVVRVQMLDKGVPGTALGTRCKIIK
jgi:ribosomal protein L35AE/L33A